MPRSAAHTRQQILDTAYVLFRGKGFTRASMDEIAAASKLTKRTLYYHFRSKDELLAAMLEAQHELALAAFKTFGDRLSGTPEAIIDGLFKGLGGLVGYAALRRLGLHAPGHRACRSARPPGPPHRATAQGHARRPSRGAAGESRSRTAARARPRDLAAVGGRHLADPGARRPQLCRRRGGCCKAPAATGSIEGEANFADSAAGGRRSAKRVRTY